MPAKKSSKAKKASKSKKGSSRSRKPSKSSLRAAVESGPVPPYGDPIRKAIARGDVQEMRKLAVSTRQWLNDVNAALADLETSLEKA